MINIDKNVSGKEVQFIKIEQIEEGDRIRQEYPKMAELINSVKELGILQPLAVKQIDDNKYLLLAGGRRLRAAKVNKFDKVPVLIFPPDINDLEVRVIEHEENFQREDITYSEQVASLKEIHKLYNELHEKGISDKDKHRWWAQADTARKLGISPATVALDLKLADAIEIMPALGKLGSKKEAMKLLSKAEDNLKLKEIAEQVQKDRKETPLEKQRQMLCDSFFVCDFFEGIKKVQDSSIDFINLDPDWGIDFLQNKMNNETDYNEVDVDDFPAFMERLAEECWRIIKEGGWCIIWHGSEWTQKICDIFEYRGFAVKRIPAIWLKGTGQNRIPDISLSKAYEQFIYVRKGYAKLHKQGRSNVFEFEREPQSKRRHPTQKPIKLYEELLDTFLHGKGRVLDAFAGSGNLILACSNKGYICHGYDLSQTYKDKFVLAVNESKPGQY